MTNFELKICTIIGVLMLSEWGRILGITCCFLSLLIIPAGTIIGAVGLFAFFGSPELFGRNRIRHKDLEKEFYGRKKRKKAS